MSETILKISLSELCEAEQINEELIIEIVEYGIAKPMLGNTLSEWIFDLESAHWIKKAVKLNQQLQIDWIATAMVINLMRKKEKLEKENSQLKARISRLI